MTLDQMRTSAASSHEGPAKQAEKKYSVPTREPLVEMGRRHLSGPMDAD